MAQSSAAVGKLGAAKKARRAKGPIVPTKAMAVIGPLKSTLSHSSNIYIAQQQADYVPSLAEAAGGIAWNLSSSIEGIRGPVIALRPGLNTLQVIAGTGDTSNPGGSFVCSFFMK